MMRKRLALLGIFALLCVALVAFAQQANVGNGVSAVPQEVTLRGKIVCFHDEFKRLYNADVDCRVDGHRGVLRAEDGSYYGMLPNIRSYVLCLEPKMLGREVEVTARLFPKSMIVQVNSHKVFDEQGKAFEAIYWCDT